MTTFKFLLYVYAFAEIKVLGQGKISVQLQCDVDLMVQNAIIFLAQKSPNGQEKSIKTLYMWGLINKKIKMGLRIVFKTW